MTTEVMSCRTLTMMTRTSAVLRKGGTMTQVRRTGLVAKLY